MFIRTTLVALLLAASAAAAAAQEHVHQKHEAGHDHDHAGGITLIEGLGAWSQEITTSVPGAQAFFDQGLRLTYGFMHEEAVRAFEEALRLDPSCAMCAWGLAYALSPNINLPMSADAEARALAAIERAQALARGVTPRERAYIEAMARRFGEPAGADRAARDSAYAAAARELAREYPNDVDAQVLYADGMLNLRPWNQWTRAGAPQPGTLEVVAVLERALAQEPNHAGACHFYIHAVEASPTPERALPCAERLPKLMPGAGHLVHMPAHVYLRTGMYEKAARANIAAVEADRGYFAKHEVEQGIYPLFYHPHNIHFLWAAYMLSGQYEKSLGAAHALRERVSIEMAREEASLQAFLTPAVLTHARFSRWDAVLAEAEPDRALRYTKGMWHHARGIAYAMRADFVAAAAELDSVRAIAAAVPEDMVIILNPAKTVLRVAELVLDARIAAATGEIDRAATLLSEAAALEDELTYDEPPPWYQPVREVLGEVLLFAGRPAEAEAAYRENLQWVRESGWSLAGLEHALRAQGKADEAKAVADRLKAAWKFADVPSLPPEPRVRFRQSTLSTGATIHWAEAGRPTGTPMILLHGYTDSWFSWSRVLPLLPPDVRAIAVDMRGHGRSGEEPGSFGVADFAADIAALMDRLGIERAAIAGHSFGSLVAQAIAAEDPSRVAGIILLGAISSGDIPAMQELRDAVRALPDPVPGDFIREFQESTAARPLPASFMERVIAESGQLSARAWRATAEGWATADFVERVAAQGTRTLLLCGDQDGFCTPDVQQRILSAVPSARLLTYEATGHALHWEQPRLVAEDLAQFVTAVGNVAKIR
ncbi:MAG TPA: alpha/beta hydrolase [Longimicrobiales bacterium]